MSMQQKPVESKSLFEGLSTGTAKKKKRKITITRENYQKLLDSGKIYVSDIPVSVFKTLTELRAVGFPHFEWKERAYRKVFDQLRFLTFENKGKRSYDEQEGVKLIPSNSRYAKLASVFFPHMFQTKVVNRMTPYDAWLDNKLLKKAIKLGKEHTVKDSGHLTLGVLRGVLKQVGSAQCVSNFRPDVAKYVYDTYGNKGKVYDFSMGYGGRLVGFLASNCSEYVGTDVNSMNTEGYQKIVQAYHHGTDSEGYRFLFNEDKKKTVRMNLIPAEKFCPSEYKGYFDLAFSSPPYFAKEHYSKDKNQSYLQYPTYKEWINGFLYRTIKNIHTMLRPGGYFVININAVKIGNKIFDLDAQTIRLAKKVGLKYVETVGYTMSITMGPMRREGAEKKFDYLKLRVDEDGRFRYEPVLVFRKDVE